MMKTIIALVLVVAASAPAGSAAAAPIEGLWQNRSRTLDVRIAPCGARYCGTIVAARGRAIEDAGKLGVKRLIGARILDDYAPARDGTWRGRVFVPQLRGQVDSRIRFVDADTLQLTGCGLGGAVCKTKLWHRLSGGS